MKKLIITLCVLLTTIYCGAQKTWKEPSQYHQQDMMMIMHLTVNDVEFKQDETIVHMAVDYPAGGYICFPKHTKLMDQDGEGIRLKER